ncbi:MAG TPA: CheB methylesterase domain-containing protein, partial [Opitutaceae bacterium]
PYSFGDLGPQLLAKVKAAAIAKLQKPDTTPDRPVVRRAARRPAPPAATTPPPSLSPAPGSSPPFASASASPFSPFGSRSPLAGPGAGAGSRSPLPARFAAARRLIVLGASTGGTEALRQVLTQLPDNLPPIAIVQHIPATFSRTFAERLNTLCNFEVREAVDGEALVPGLALVAPGNYHLLVHWTAAGYRVTVTDGPQVWHQRPAVDLLFKSAAEAAGRHAIAGVLTGMGKDGAEGLLRLRNAGAVTFAQDEASSVVYGMPRAAWELGAAQHQLSLYSMSDFIVRAAAEEPAASSVHAPA